jgi:hypothetical protein
VGDRALFSIDCNLNMETLSIHNVASFKLVNLKPLWPLGTLSPLAATPALAFIPNESKKVLERMSHMPDVNIVIISGRDVDDLKQKVTFSTIFSRTKP